MPQRLVPAGSGIEATLSSILESIQVVPAWYEARRNHLEKQLNQARYRSNHVEVDRHRNELERLESRLTAWKATNQGT